MEPPPRNSLDSTPLDELVPRIITIRQEATGPLLLAASQPGQTSLAVDFGQAQFSADAIEAGGFGNISFTASDAILFSGNVNLTAGQSIALNSGSLADTGTAGTVAIAAPFVLVSGFPADVILGSTQFSTNIVAQGHFSS